MNRTLRQWQWEFESHRFSGAPVPYAVVKDGDQVVGTQALIPIRMIDREGIFWTAKSEETLVDPAYRGQQLFEKMYQLMFQYAEEHKLAYIWGFSPAIKAFTKLGFATPGVTQQLFLPFSTRSVTTMLSKQQGSGPESARNRLKAAAISLGGVAARIVSASRVALSSRQLPLGLQIRTMDQADPQAGKLCEHFIRQWGGTTIYRDAEYLQWRLFDNPYVRSIVRGIYDGQELLGWVAFTLGDDGLGYLVDMMVCTYKDSHNPMKLVQALLLDVVLHTRNMGATGVRGWRVNEHPFDRLVCRAARKVGFYHIKHGHAVVQYTGTAGKERSGATNFNEWYVTRVYTEGVLG